jgi:phage terminase large subunit GpA-like protein
MVTATGAQDQRFAVGPHLTVSAGGYVRASHRAAALVTLAVAVASGHAAYTVWAATRADGWARVELVAGGASGLAMAGMLVT